METALADFIRDTADGRRAEDILRKCVHCGFCTATCPTYQLLGDELDGPRGRIYLIKQVLEGREVTGRTQLHLDRCLTCRSCETTCPSGVRYGELVDIGREVVESKVGRRPVERIVRRLLREVIPHRGRFGPLLRLGQAVRPVLTGALKAKVPVRRRRGRWPATGRDRKMIAMQGCAQAAIAPNINATAARYLDAHGISLVEAPASGCCGAVDLHLAHTEPARRFMRRNIDAWWPLVEAGAEAIVMTASGCGVTVRDYGRLLAEDDRYADRAARISEMTLDIAEVAAGLGPVPGLGGAGKRVAFHSPCTLQHGQRIVGQVEQLLEDAGYRLCQVADSHLCCGSAGTYSILQPEISRRLRDNKVASLLEDRPDLVATANIGCLAHLETAGGLTVRHWIELLAPD